MVKPAIEGGTPVRSTKIFYGHQHLDQADYDAVLDVLKSDYLTCGPKINELEEKLVGLAACSADCDNMWQIGVDVLPEYRRMGIASSLTSNLAIEIIERGKVPFYCCAWSNLKSVKNALRSGFVPGWVEMTVKAASLVDEMNK